MDIASNISSMQNMEIDDKEFILEYVQRWFGVAIQVDPPLLEKEMVNLFTNTFKMLCFEFLIGNTT